MNSNNKKYVKAATSGNDRFYVVALENVDTDEHKWYSAAWNDGYGNMNDFDKDGGDDKKGTPTSTAFGSGRKNTEMMIKKGIQESYGQLDDNDIWDILINGWTQEMKDKWIEDGYNAINSLHNMNWGIIRDGWFVPSKDEWNVLKGTLNGNIGNGNYMSPYDIGLRNGVWSSSQAGKQYAWRPKFSTSGGKYLIEITSVLYKTYTYLRMANTF